MYIPTNKNILHQTSRIIKEIKYIASKKKQEHYYSYDDEYEELCRKLVLTFIRKFKNILKN